MAASEPPRRHLGREPLRPDRVRAVDAGGFAFIPNRFLRDGFFAALEPDELRLYLLFVLAGDRRGMSFYHYDSICALLELQLEDYLAARDGLLRQNLIAFDGTRTQVLALPTAPLPRQEPFPTTDADPTPGPRDPAVREAILACLRSTT